MGAFEAVLVDAALNLNPRAFRNLVAAEREVRVLRDVALHFEVYPSHLTDEHLRFLSEIRLAAVGLGLQSYDEQVLRRLERPFDPSRFEAVVRALAELGAEVNIEIIVGLPGDTPDAFRRTLERARRFPCNVRAYHCLVLPDALMTRAPPWADMDFDPHTLLMRRCAGWSERDLRATFERLDAEGAEELEGTLWFFPRGGQGTAQGAAPPPPHAAKLARPIEVLPRPVIARISSVVSAATNARWSVDEIERAEGGVTLRITTPAGALTVVLEDARTTSQAYRVVGDVAVSYRDSMAPLTPDALRTLEHLSIRASALFHQLVHGDAPTPSRAKLPLPLSR